MLIVNVKEAAGRLKELVDRAMAGEPIFLSVDGKAVVKIEPLTAEEALKIQSAAKKADPSLHSG